MTSFNPCSDQIAFQASKAEAKTQFDAIGGRIVGVILALYGVAVLFEVVRSYVLVS